MSLCDWEETTDGYDVVVRTPITFFVRFPREEASVAENGSVDCACVISEDVCICYVSRRREGLQPTRQPCSPPPGLTCQSGRMTPYREGAATSAKSAIDGNSQSGVTFAGGGGVAPQPGRSWRRLIHTVCRPARLAGT